MATVAIPATIDPSPEAEAPAVWHTQPTLLAMMATALSFMPIEVQCLAQIVAASGGILYAPATPTGVVQPMVANILINEPIQIALFMSGRLPAGRRAIPLLQRFA